FFFQAEDGIRDFHVTGVQTCALPILAAAPTDVSGEIGFALDRMPTLRQTPVAELRELSFPYPGDPTDVFTLKTDRGNGYLDQGRSEERRVGKEGRCRWTQQP